MMDMVAYREQLQALLPPGRAWPRDDDADLTRLLAALADEFARIDARASALIDEADPLTALELLPDWERAAGLPDACVPIAEGIRARQIAVARKIAGLGGQSRAYFIDLAARIGLEVSIEEYAPFTAVSTVDGPLYDDDWRHVFTVRALPPSESSNDPTRLRFADFTTESTVDQALRIFGIEDLECVITRARPAHSIIQFAYPQDPEPMLWFDFLSQ